MPHVSLCKQLSAAVALSLPLVLGACAENTLRVATHAQLETIDPIWTTAYITRTHGYLVYDTLFALDENLEPRPQMVDTWTVSPDQKVWTFKLRDDLTWSDGTPVTAQDCVASLERWAKRDGMGQQLFRNVSGLAAPDAKTIVMTLRTPYQLVLESLVKMSSNVPFMMPKRVADADPYKPIQDATGSGPYVLEKGKWQPGSEAFYAKNTRYVPRAEPELLAAGGKIAKADEIELRFFPNQADAVNALLKGDIDYLELPSIKFLPALEAMESEHHRRLDRSTRQYRHHALQFRAAAVQQSEVPGAPCSWRSIRTTT